jgi:hypothetical protein
MSAENGATVDRRTVRAAIELAAHAPSVHNSQPWRWVVGPHSVHLYADRRRWLPSTDADGRDLVVSCGAVLHHLRVALAATGLAAEVLRLPNPDEEDHLAAVTVRPATATDADLALAQVLLDRRTDRRRYGSWPVPDGFIAELIELAADQGAVLRPVTSAHMRDVLRAAIREADQVQEDTAGYRTETALWSGGATDGAGIPAANLLRDPAGSGGPTRRFSAGTIEQAPSGEEDGAALLVIGTASDDTLSRLRAGEATSAVLLHATELGLAGCPLSQPLEIGRTRAIVREQVLGGTLSPQLVLRVGWAPTGPALPATPRRPVDDTIERMP